MEKEQILEEVNKIFKNELEDDDVVVNAESTAKDVDGWDSLTHIQVVVAIEKRFKIRFKASEVANFKNVGEMCDDIYTKINS